MSSVVISLERITVHAPSQGSRSRPLLKLEVTLEVSSNAPIHAFHIGLLEERDP